MTEIDETYAAASKAFDADNLVEAGKLIGQFLAREPNHAPAIHLRGMILGKGGRLKEAAAEFRHAIALWPVFADAYFSLGFVLGQLGDWENSAVAYREASRLRPESVVFVNNLGNALLFGGHIDEAVECYRRAINLRPNYATAHCNLGGALDQVGRSEEAIDSLKSALACDPNCASASNNLGKALVGIGQIADGLAAYDRAIAIEPRVPSHFSGKLYSLQFAPDVQPEQLLREHVRFGEWHELQSKVRPHDNDRSLERALRIGYVSADFREHVVGWNLLPIMEHQNPGVFEFFGYSSVLRPDATTAKIAARTHGWREIASVSDDRAAQIVREDKIDILVDLAGHSAGNRLLLFAEKPAPIQITYLGYNAPTGLQAMDYRISDPYLDNPETEKDYNEKVLYLPNSYWCYRPPGKAPDVSPGPASSNGFVTFACLNNFPKMSLPAQEAWSEILTAIRGSHLILTAQGAGLRQELVQRFSSWGIGANRLEFVPRLSWEEYMGVYNRADIALDPFPYGGGISTCDALWMGVAVVTHAGRTAVGRSGKSILSNVGLQELIGDDVKEYVSIAIQLAGDLPKLRDLRENLRERMRRSPLMNAEQFAADLESLYRRVWRNYCIGGVR